MTGAYTKAESQSAWAALGAESRLFFEGWFLCDFLFQDRRIAIELFLEREGKHLRRVGDIKRIVNISTLEQRSPPPSWPPSP